MYVCIIGETTLGQTFQRWYSPSSHPLRRLPQLAQLPYFEMQWFASGLATHTFPSHFCASLPSSAATAAFHLAALQEDVTRMYGVAFDLDSGALVTW